MEAVEQGIQRAGSENEAQDLRRPRPTARLVTVADYHRIADARLRTEYPTNPLLEREVSVERYIDPAFLSREKERIFRKTWQIAGRIAQLPEPGMYFVYDMVDYSLLFTKDGRGALHGFINTCRHRGCELAEDCGKVQRFVCRYHAWAYDLSGKLIAVPEHGMYQGLDKSTHGLIPLQVDTWGGFIWFNIEQEAVPLPDYLGPLYEHACAFPWDRLESVYSHTYEVEANWKLALDNFNEMYHVPFTHKDSAAPHIDWRKSLVEPLGRHSRFYFGNSSTSPTHRALQGEATTASEKLYAELAPAAREFGYTYQLFPNAFLFPWSDYLVLARLYPLGVDRCRISIDHYGLPPETEAETMSMDGRIAFNALVMREDFGLLPAIQRGLRSGGIMSMPLGYLELAMANFHHTLDRYMEC